MIIAQLTDLHVVARGQKLSSVLDTIAMARDAVTHVNELAPRPDLVLATGDLVDNGEPAEYEMLRELLDELRAPYYVIPGNHDRRAALLESFQGHLEADANGFVQYVIDGYPARLVALDTLNEGEEDGLLCDERLAWLDQTLSEEPDQPTLIFMHHPPFETGVWWMDAAGLAGSGKLRDLVERHTQIQRIICGHVHRPIQMLIGRALVSVAPSTAYQVHLDLTPESPPRIILEPPACTLHVWNGEAFVSHTSYVKWPHPPIDLSDEMGGWEVVRGELRAKKDALR